MVRKCYCDSCNKDYTFSYYNKKHIYTKKHIKNENKKNKIKLNEQREQQRKNFPKEIVLPKEIEDIIIDYKNELENIENDKQFIVNVISNNIGITYQNKGNFHFLYHDDNEDDFQVECSLEDDSYVWEENLKRNIQTIYVKKINDNHTQCSVKKQKDKGFKKINKKNYKKLLPKYSEGVEEYFIKKLLLNRIKENIDKIFNYEKIENNFEYKHIFEEMDPDYYEDIPMLDITNFKKVRKILDYFL